MEQQWQVSLGRKIENSFLKPIITIQSFTGPAGQAGVAIANPDEKVKAVENKSKEENKKTSDPYY